MDFHLRLFKKDTNILDIEHLFCKKHCSNCEKKEYIKFFWDRILQISFPELRVRISRSVDFFKELDLHSTERIIMTWREA